MISYEFGKRERGFGKIVFALAIDRKKMTERIVIGEMSETRRHLDNGTGAIYFDQTRPLGTLLIDFEAERWKIAVPVSDFLRGKYESGEPSALLL